MILRRLLRAGRAFAFGTSEDRARIERRAVRKIRSRAPGLDRAVRAVRAAVETRYLRSAPGSDVVMDIARFPYMGYGASVGWLQAGFLAQRAAGGDLYVTNPEGWPFGGRRAEARLDRFLEFPGARVTAPAEVPEGALPLEAGNWSNLRRWGYFDDIDWRHCLFGYVPASAPSLEAFRRDVFAASYRLTPESLAAVQARMPPLKEPYVAWHVRRGDKTAGPWQEDRPVELERYVEATRRLLSRREPPPRLLSVCTDSDEALAEVSNMVRRELPQLEVVQDEHERRWNGYCALHRTGAIQDVSAMVEEIFTAQKIVQILRGATLLVGCNSSCLFRVAGLLHPDPASVISLSENKAWKPYFPL